MEEREFAAGTTARCNRCDCPSPLPKAVKAIRENDKAWRLQGFAKLDCGHVDCHWVYERDLVQAEGKERMMEQSRSFEQKVADAAVPLADVQRAVFGPEPEPMYAGGDRVKQVAALDQLAEDIFQALHPDVPLDEITLNGLDQGGYFPEEWPDWSGWRDEMYVVSKVREKVQRAAWAVADAKIGSGRP